jgi:hypothetical protein
VTYHWFVRYGCGCSDDARRKRDLLEYCKFHGHDAVEWLKVPGSIVERRAEEAQT